MCIRDRGKDVNWFYYWMQTSASSGIAGVDVIACESIAAGEYTIGDQMIHLCDPQSYWPTVRFADGAPTAYIDTFATILIHEDKHRKNSRTWWENARQICEDTNGDGVDDQVSGCVMDTDRDKVPDAIEPGQTAPDGHNLGLVVANKYSCTLSPTGRAYLLPGQVDREDSAGENETVQSTGIDDEECTAYWEETRWPIGSARSEDWAAPGSQWAGAAP